MPTTSRAGAPPTRAAESGPSGRAPGGPARRACTAGRDAAAPQMFLSPDGRRIYNYGGWTSRGPQTDLAVSSADAYEAFARGEEAEPRFRLCPSSGSPADPGGAQSLTPLWLPGGGAAPSQAHVASLAPAGFLRAGDRAHLIPAFGGGLGGYRFEHDSWAVGVLDRRARRGLLRIGCDLRAYGTLTRRCAHTATHVPARCFAKEAQMFLGGGRDLLWRPHRKRKRVGSSAGALRQVLELVRSADARSRSADTRPQASPPSATRAPRRVVGGGTGSILDDPARCQEHSIAQVLEVGWNPFVGQELSANFLAPVQLAHVSYVPGRHHTACRVSQNCVVLYGGGDNPDPAVCVLDLAAVVDAAVEAAASAQTERGGRARRAIARCYSREALRRRPPSRCRTSVAAKRRRRRASFMLPARFTRGARCSLYSAAGKSTVTSTTCGCSRTVETSRATVCPTATAATTTTRSRSSCKLVVVGSACSSNVPRSRPSWRMGDLRPTPTALLPCSRRRPSRCRRGIRRRRRRLLLRGRRRRQVLLRGGG